jgi:DeoR/GlpR family transcriptional regulator of sugar metabolism
MSDYLFVAERRRAILEQLRSNGRVSVKMLSDTMRVSTVTIRHDLRVLEEDGLLERTYGGAVARSSDSASPRLTELSFAVRNAKDMDAKDAIAAFAVSLVRENYSIALDASTTAYALVPYLQNFNKMTIMTNNLIIAQSFLEHPGIEVIIPGGRLRKESVSIVGRTESLPDVNLNFGFFGAWGISTQGGISDIDPDEVAMKQALMARCINPIIIADASKWGQIAPYTVVPAVQVRHIITTGGASHELVQQFREQGTQVDVVEKFAFTR